MLITCLSTLLLPYSNYISLFLVPQIQNSFFFLWIYGSFSWNMFLLVVSMLVPFHHSSHSLKVTSSEEPSQTIKPQWNLTIAPVPCLHFILLFYCFCIFHHLCHNFNTYSNRISGIFPPCHSSSMKTDSTMSRVVGKVLAIRESFFIVDPYWSWDCNTLAAWCEQRTLCKNPDAGKDWGQEEKEKTEDEMVGWHHWLSWREFEKTMGDGRQGSLACCSSWGWKSQTQLSIWTTTGYYLSMRKLFSGNLK